MANKFNIQETIKLLSVVVVVILLSLMFPTNQAEKLPSTVGDIWNQDDLFAQSDFEVYKSEKAIENERKQLSSKLVPRFTRNDSKTKSSINRATEYLVSNVSQLSGYDGYIREILTNLYDQGLVDQKNKAPNFELDNSGTKTKVASSQVYDKKEFNSAIQKELEKIGVDETIRSQIDVSGFLQANLIFDKAAFDEKINFASKNLPLVESIIKKGELIIAKGEQIDANDARKIQSYNQFNSKFSLSSGNNILRYLGFLILSCLIIGTLLFYLRKYYDKIDDHIKTLVFILMWPLIFGFFVFAIERYTNLSVYLIPFCMVPIIVKNFFDARLALFVHVVVILIASILSKEGYEFTFLQILAGIITVLFVSETRYWNKFFITILLILGTYTLGQIGLDLIDGGSFKNIDFKRILFFAANGVLLMLAYPFIPLIERIFGFTSSISLAELSDMNRPLLKELSIKAPGTLQHSLQVANLSEAAADKIGANSLLVKTAALYHDIGKMTKPAYFIENAKPGINLHNELDNNIESAKIIIDHVSDGIAMAKKARLPKVIVDIIASHHGTTRVEYFYRNEKSKNPHLITDESLFRYPGPRPVTKEQTILMIADSLEAASKSLKSPTGKDIDDLVENIVKYKIEQHQLEDSNLSFEELESCKDVFKSLLRSINHVRIEYPEDKTN